ncbi:hypothetical protein Tco_0328300 [Tanacetum coccineum]
MAAPRTTHSPPYTTLITFTPSSPPPRHHCHSSHCLPWQPPCFTTRTSSPTTYSHISFHHHHHHATISTKTHTTAATFPRVPVGFINTTTVRLVCIGRQRGALVVVAAKGRGCSCGVGAAARGGWQPPRRYEGCVGLWVHSHGGVSGWLSTAGDSRGAGGVWLAAGQPGEGA